MLLLILEKLKQASFFWRDFAPRNIIISKNMKSVYLVDFEKGLLKNQGWEDYLSLIFEELSIFLLPSIIILTCHDRDELLFLSDHIYKIDQGRISTQENGGII